MNFTDPNTIITIVLVLAVIALAYLVWQLDAKLKKFILGSGSENLNDSLSTLDSSVRGLESFKKEIDEYLATVESRLKKTTQGIYTVRFNPFAGSTGSGGNQSFATAFINEQGDGVVISSLYARDHVSVFAKPVKNSKSEYELSEEEVTAIEEAFKLAK